MVKVTERKTALDWACFIEEIAAQYEHAEKITLVMDNFSTHNAGSFYEKFMPDKAKALMNRFEFVYNNKQAKVKWHFTTEDARVKLVRLYPTLDC